MHKGLRRRPAAELHPGGQGQPQLRRRRKDTGKKRTLVLKVQAEILCNFGLGRRTF